ncbi:MAG: hypothetical protein GXO83_06055 [Chlorobi bacterium]|nr:hypothetical protein [Chlorobiota bacterium]
MSSKRILKKEVNRLIQEFISDAFTIIGTHPDRREPVIAQITDAVALRNETVRKINHPEKPEGMTLRQTLGNVQVTFLKELDVIYQNLSEITADKKKPAKTTGKTAPRAEAAVKESPKEL